MSGGAFVVCVFAALDDIPKKKRSDPLVVLRALEKAGRFSAFEVDDRIAGALYVLKLRKWIECDITCGYPWTGVTLTGAGRAALAAEVAT